MSLFSKETLKSKTFWGVVALGALSLGGQFVVIPAALYSAIQTVIVTFTGVAAVDRSTKVIDAAKPK